MYIVTIKIDGDENEYQKQILLSDQLKRGEEITTGNKEYAFIFDTKTKEFYDDTENGTGLWSSKYQTTSTILPNVPIL
jgi:hypothetical protein